MILRANVLALMALVMARPHGGVQPQVQAETFRTSCALSLAGLLCRPLDPTMPPKLWNLTTGNVRQTFVGSEAPVQHLAINRRGTLVATAVANTAFFVSPTETAVRLWDVASGKELRRYNYPPLGSNGDPFRSLAFSDDGTNLLVVTTSVNVWDTRSGALRFTLNIGDIISLLDDDSLAPIEAKVSTDLKNIVILYRNDVLVFDLGTSKLKCRIKPFGDGADTRFIDVAFSGDSTRLVTSEPNKQSVWNANNCDLATTYITQIANLAPVFLARMGSG